MLNFFVVASDAKSIGISAPDPDIFKKEALKYAQMFGDAEMHFYNTHKKPFLGNSSAI